MRWIFGSGVAVVAATGTCLSPIPVLAEAVRFSESVLHSFDGEDGSHPIGRLVLASDGNLYGTTNSGGGGNCRASGNSGCGVIFRISPSSGIYTVLHRFNASPDGAQPLALVEGIDGNFYGVTQYGEDRGINGLAPGTIFRITSSGDFTVLHQFGSYPAAELTLGPDGNLFGATGGGGAGGGGTIFRITTEGVFTVLHSFEVGGVAARNPNTALLLAADGNFYGTTSSGGSEGFGTVFRASPAGALTILASFQTYSGAEAIGGGLVQGSDGNIYGARAGAGTNSAGAVFWMAPEGSLLEEYSFPGPTALIGPRNSLVEGDDGAFYGAAGGGTYNAGAIYKITPTGVLTSLYSFEGGPNHGTDPSPLTKANGDIFYGVTYGGGVHDAGTIFRLAMVPLDPPINLSAAAGNASITLSWAAAEGATSYSVFQGQSAGDQSPRLALSNITGTSVTIGDLSNGVNYYFRVASENSTGVSALSAEVSAAPVAPPAPPANVQAEPGDGQVTLSWAASPGASGYNVYQGTTAGGQSDTPIRSNLAATSTVITDLTNGRPYFFTVAAVNSSGISSPSAEVSASPQAAMSSGGGGSGGGSVGFGTLLLMAGLVWSRRQQLSRA